MKIIKQYHEILNISHPDSLLDLESYARTCYQSNDKITPDSAEKLIKRLIDIGHDSQLEHCTITIKFITNRGVLTELTRHRIGVAYSVESTRYVNYKNSDMEFILPVWFEDNINIERNDLNEHTWVMAMGRCEKTYKYLVDNEWSPQQARDILPNGLKTEIILTANLRALRHLFMLRCDKPAHPQIRSLMINCLKDVHSKIPVVFEDIYNKYCL